MERAPCIEVVNLSKVYRDPMRIWRTINAVTDLSFSLEPGEIVGFVGHNGAGKTTTIKMLLGFIAPTAGRIGIFGADPGDPERKKRIGFLPERPYFYSHLTGRELLRYFCALSEIPRATAKAAIEKTLQKVGLADAGDLMLTHYSKGMLQRVGIAQAIIHNPEVVIMDEPMSGLDPLGRHEVKEIIRELRKEGKAVLFSSHILADIEDLSDRVLIVEKGARRFFGPLADIVLAQDIRWRVSFSAPEQEHALIFSSFKGAHLDDGRFSLTLTTEQEMNALLPSLIERRYTIVAAGPVYPTLEEIVFHMKDREAPHG